MFVAGGIDPAVVPALGCEAGSTGAFPYDPNGVPPPGTLGPGAWITLPPMVERRYYPGVLLLPEGPGFVL